MSGRKGAATSLNCSQYSSTDDGQRPAMMRSSSWTLLNPAASSARRSRPRSPNMKRLGPSGSGGGGGTGTCFRTIPAVVVKNGCSFLPQATNAARPPGLSTRKHSRSALGGSGKNITPKRQGNQAYDSPPNG